MPINTKMFDIFKNFNRKRLIREEPLRKSIRNKKTKRKLVIIRHGSFWYWRKSVSKWPWVRQLDWVLLDGYQLYYRADLTNGANNWCRRRFEWRVCLLLYFRICGQLFHLWIPAHLHAPLFTYRATHRFARIPRQVLHPVLGPLSRMVLPCCVGHFWHQLGAWIRKFKWQNPGSRQSSHLLTPREVFFWKWSRCSEVYWSRMDLERSPSPGGLLSLFWSKIN